MWAPPDQRGYFWGGAHQERVWASISKGIFLGGRAPGAQGIRTKGDILGDILGGGAHQEREAAAAHARHAAAAVGLRDERLEAHDVREARQRRDRGRERALRQFAVPDLHRVCRSFDEAAWCMAAQLGA